MFTIYVFKIRFYSLIDEKKREIINIIKEYLIIINNTHNYYIFKFENLCVFSKKLRCKNFLVIYIY